MNYDITEDLMTIISPRHLSSNVTVPRLRRTGARHWLQDWFRLLDQVTVGTLMIIREILYQNQCSRGNKSLGSTCADPPLLRLLFSRIDLNTDHP
jgi:hypothetical protein